MTSFLFSFSCMLNMITYCIFAYSVIIFFSRSHSSQQQRHSSSPYLNSRQRSTSESEPHPQPPPRTKTSKAKLKKASTELQAVKLNRSMSESNVIASLRYGRSDDDNDMEVSSTIFDRELIWNFSIFDCMPLSRGLKKMK